MPQIEEVVFGLQTNDVVGLTPIQRTAVEMSICVSIAKEGKAVYKNMKYPRDKCFYGYAQVMFGTHVIREVPINFLNQEIVHWRDESFGINDTTVCMAKLLASALPEPVVISGKVVKTRQPITSVRFEFNEDALANVILRWENGQSSCNNNVEEPNGDQGNPPEPANRGHNPSARPPAQGGDDFDNSPNDGQPRKPGELEPPSTPGANDNYGFWYLRVTWEDGYSQVYPLGDPQASAVYQGVGKCFAGVQGAVSPQGKSGIGMFRNGTYFGCSEDVMGHGSTVKTEFYYY